MELLAREETRLLLLLLAGVGFALQWDNLIEDIRKARKGGDSNSDKEKPSPPKA